jgi:hypothetical protein
MFNDDLLQEETHIKFLGIEIDKSLNWKTQVKSIVPKLGKACFVIRKMKLYSNIETLKMICYAHFQSLLGYGIVFWGDSSEAKKIFLLQKKAIRIIMGMKHRESCRPAFKKTKNVNIDIIIHFILDDSNGK